jgi:hypothetical protein
MNLLLYVAGIDPRVYPSVYFFHSHPAPDISISLSPLPITFPDAHLSQFVVFFLVRCSINAFFLSVVWGGSSVA